MHWRIHGNAHTHRGHFHVCAIGVDEHRSVNLGDVVKTSEQARIWLDGFLAGQEPGLEEFVGDDTEPTDDDVERWLAWNAAFRARGYGIVIQPMPPARAVLDTLGAPVPWAYVGGLYRVWTDGAWRVADPQPTPAADPPGWAWPGSVCERRRHCEIAQLDDLAVCDDCHHVSV